MSDTTIPTPEQLDAALELRFSSDAGENLTIREWLTSLLLLVWADGEGFNGKRPWGNSGWEWDVYYPLVEGGFVEGAITHPYDDDPEYTELDAVDDKAADAFVAAMIRRMGGQ